MSGLFGLDLSQLAPTANNRQNQPNPTRSKPSIKSLCTSVPGKRHVLIVMLLFNTLRARTRTHTHSSIDTTSSCDLCYCIVLVICSKTSFDPCSIKEHALVSGSSQASHLHFVGRKGYGKVISNHIIRSTSTMLHTRLFSYGFCLPVNIHKMTAKKPHGVLHSLSLSWACPCICAELHCQAKGVHANAFCLKAR